MIKIILIILTLVKAAVAIFFLVKDYKTAFQGAEIKTAIQNKDISKLKAVLKTLWQSVKSLKFASLISDIIIFILVLFV